MSRSSDLESHAIDTGMSRAVSRAGSISTLWSSAEVPLCLDPRVQLSSDGFQYCPARSRSIADSISPNSPRSSQISMHFGRLSIDIPDEYPRRPDSVRFTPPPTSASASSSAISSARLPSSNIGTIDEDKPMQSSSISKIKYQPPSHNVQQRLLSSRFSEDTIDEPHLPHSGSQRTFAAQFSIAPSQSPAGLSDLSGTDSSRSSSIQHTDPSPALGRTLAPAQAPAELHRRAYRSFDKEYTVQPRLQDDSLSGSSFVDRRQVAYSQRFDPSSGLEANDSQLSHERSTPSSSRSQGSTHASSSDSASASSAEGTMSRSSAITGGPVAVLDNSHRADSYPAPDFVAPDVSLSKMSVRTASTEKCDTLSIPLLPSIPSFNSTLTATLTATRADHTRDIRRRPSTADVYSQASHVSPHTFSNLPLPLLLPAPSPTEPVRYEVQPYSMDPAQSPASKSTRSTAHNADMANKSTTSRLLRARFASTPKLRLDTSSLFFSEEAMRAQPPVPPLPGPLSHPATDRRPSTAQMDGCAPFFGRRFRSRTLGESDRLAPANMQAAVAATRSIPSPTSAPRTGMPSGLSASAVSHRRPNQVSATSSELHSPMWLMQPTPGSSICSASSLATTNNSLPVTPRTTTAFLRPKSRGNNSAAKSGGAGWASYLHSGLTLHLEQDNGRVSQLNMTYLAYDPFGRPEQLVQGSEAARALMPKGPKSRGDKDQEAEQCGTIEFGPSEDMRPESCFFDLPRKADRSILLKHLTSGDDTKADLLTRQAALSLKTAGSHQVSGYERKGRLAWKFAYRVEQDSVYPERRRLVSLRFSCSATLLNPERARKSRLLNLVKKQMGPTLASKAVAGSSNDSPRSASFPYEDVAFATTTASPASSRFSSKQLAPEAQPPPVSPIRRNNGTGAATGGFSNYDSPLRQASRTVASGNSIASADSSFCSQPVTPGRDSSMVDPTLSRMHLQASPASAHFASSSTAQRQLQSVGAASAAVAPALQLDLGNVDINAGQSSRKLQQKASMASLGAASSISSDSVQLAQPVVINGRKLIPISLPAGLARRRQIDPTLLQANVIPSSSLQQRLVSPTSQPDLRAAAARQRSTSMHSSASSSEHSQRKANRHEVNGLKCLLSNQPRTANVTSSSSRSPTAPETIKLEYLARSASEQAQQQTEHQQQLRHHKSFTGALLTPSAFADGTRQARRQRSKTTENGGQQRPFTADAWGESQFPTREQIATVRAFGQKHTVEMERQASYGSSAGSHEINNRHIIPREILAGSFNSHSSSERQDQGEMSGYKPLPAPPRPQTRPRTAQTITAADKATSQQSHGRYHIPAHTVHAVRS
ncbi:uncharacterized protein UDID_08689 [Ustilago sp. UG-2017a]|nr:uncharacterized protein UDID_08689 [Ustilago sp. UG-2017a]